VTMSTTPKSPSKSEFYINTHGVGSGILGQDRSVPISIQRKDVKILLLEGIHQNAVSLFESNGFTVTQTKSLAPEQLLEEVKDCHVIGVRSKTQLTKEVLANAKHLMAIGCFCIGTDQTDLKFAQANGIPVFNAPYSNTRSVAELVIGHIVYLARKMGDRLMEMHRGEWRKTAVGCFEVRGKTIGIVGYGHVGSQVSLLAESMGMRVIAYDHQPKLMLGNATAVDSLDEVLTTADFVTLHVPLTDVTENMISAPQLAKMKKGSYLLNLARGGCVDLDALADAIKSGHIAGCSVDVFPVEPLADGPGFTTPLQGLPNVILSPHIGGSTQEAQAAIGTEVAGRLVSLLNHGATLGAVNFPELDIRPKRTGTRVMNIHQNVPGVLGHINSILSKFNIEEQVLGTSDHVGYLICRLAEPDVGDAVRDEIAMLPTSIRTRHIPNDHR